MTKHLLGVSFFAVAALSFCSGVFATETETPTRMSKTLVVVKLGSAEPVMVRTKFQEKPPTISIEFPGRRIVGSLPERSAISKGVIQTITASYDIKAADTNAERFIRSVQIVLVASYTYKVRSEVGQIVVEIDHPASVGSTSFEVGLRGGTIIEALSRPSITDRFRAMQDALNRATPTPWTMQLGQKEAKSPEPVSVSWSAVSASQANRPTLPASRQAPSPATPAFPAAQSVFQPLLIWGLCALAGLWIILRAGTFSASRALPARVASGVVLIDQLVWSAFERQGFRLVAEQPIARPLAGTLRIIEKEGNKWAFLFVGQNTFFEKRTIEQFAQIMRQTSLEQGILVASGAFTVPAQRTAKLHHITLIGREQLAELLSVGAASEYVIKQLELHQARLQEVQASLVQYAGELDELRKQRNEASWSLGEERAKTAQLESQLSQVAQQLQQSTGDLEKWKQEAVSLRKHWEESEWYLGEAKAHIQHLESQVNDLQSVAKQVETATREKDEAKWYSGEERTKREALEMRFAALEENLQESLRREHFAQELVSRLKAQVEALRQYGERRQSVRLRVPEATVEIRNGGEEPLFSGSPKDISRTGFGCETEHSFPAIARARLRLQLPGFEPIESTGKLVWQQASAGPNRFYGGFQFDSLEESVEAKLDQWLKTYQETIAS